MSIVLVTDGQNNADLTYQELRDQFARDFASRSHPRVCTLLLGESNVQEPRELAEWTGGRAFDARRASLVSASKTRPRASCSPSNSHSSPASCRRSSPTWPRVMRGALLENGRSLELKFEQADFSRAEAQPRSRHERPTNHDT